jgi:MFS transporter, DHA1 family, multidrug resistance protein
MSNIKDFLNNHKPVIVILGIQLAAGIITSPLRVFLPIYLKEFLSFRIVTISFIIALGQVLAMITSLAAGALSDVIGRRKILLIGIAALAIGPLLFLSRHFLLTTTIGIISISSISFRSLGGMGIMIAETNPAKLGFVSALFHWGLTIGGVIGGLAAGIILDNWGYSSFGLIFFLFSLVTFLFGLNFLPGKKVDLQNKQKSAIHLKVYYLLLKRKSVLMIGLLRFLPTVYWGMANVLIPILIKDVSNSNTTVALYASISSALATIAQAMVGKSSDKWGSRNPMLFCFIVLILSIFGLAAFPQNIPGLFFFGSVAACAAWSLSTLLPGMVAEFILPEHQGRSLGFFQTAWSAGMIIGSVSGGILLEIKLGLPFLLVGFLNLTAIILLFKLYNKSNQVPQAV